MRLFIPETRSTLNGFQTLIKIYEQISRASTGEDIILDFKWTHWFDANLLAVISAISDNYFRNGNQIQIANIYEFESLWERNGFLSFFGHEIKPDPYRSTINCTKFLPGKAKDFEEYLEKKLLTMKEMPLMSPLLKKHIKHSTLEIFANAETHGQCQSVFTCGQYFRTYRRLDFTIVDIGQTIHRNVEEFLGRAISAEEAIKWAVQEGHTTKKGPIPGGLGFTIIREFLKNNNGSCQIISDNGFWQEKGQQIETRSFDDAFDGTIVNLEFNMADKSLHYIIGETFEDIF